VESLRTWILIVYSDPAQTIEVKAGQGFVMALDENPTVGYTWQEEFDDSFPILKRILTESYPRTYKPPYLSLLLRFFLLTATF